YSAGSRPRAGARIWWGDESECGMSRRHVGQRGSQHVKACAISRRMVGKESAKWSSGRDFERTRSTLPFGRGGEMLHSLSDDEGVAAERDSHVVVPAGETATFEVVEAEFALHLLVDQLGPIALLEGTDDLLLAHRAFERRERELGRRLLALGPFGDQPDRLVRAGVETVVVGDLHAAEREARRHFAALAPGRSLAPRDAAKCLRAQLAHDVARTGRLSAPSFLAIEPPHRRRRMDPQRIVEAENSHRLAEVVRVAVATVTQQDATGQSGVDRPWDNLQREVVLGPENHV